MPFLLNSEAQLNGTTHVTYDAGPTNRVNVVTLTEHVHEVLQIPADTLFEYSLATVRSATRRNKQS